jgi:hypothetical protein
LGRGTNWQDAVFRTAFQHQHQVAAQGGTEKVKYYVSGGMMDQDGTIIGSNFKRLNVRANLDAQLKKWFKIGMNTTYTRAKERLLHADGTEGVITYALTTPPDIAIYDVDGNYTSVVRDGWSSPNPIAQALSKDITMKRNKLTGNIFAACNEPGMNETSGKSDMWKDKYAVERVVRYEQTMIDAVRATGGNNASRTIIVQGLGADISNTCNYMDNPDETEVATFPTDKVPDRLMVEVHFYEPYLFCLLDKDGNDAWSKCYYYWGKDNKLAGSNRNTPDNYAEAWVDAQMAKIKAKFVDKGIPVIIGEYAAIFRTLGEGEDQELHDKSVAYFDEYVTKVAKDNGCVPFYWETGDVIDCTNGVVKKQYIFDAIMKGASQGKYPW